MSAYRNLERIEERNAFEREFVKINLLEHIIAITHRTRITSVILGYGVRDLHSR